MLDSNCPTSSRLTPNDRVLFLDFDGVLHPDNVYRTRSGLELRAPGQLMMHAGILIEILKEFPQVKISLSTSWVRILGYRRARAALPPELQVLTVSSTWHSRMPKAPFEGYDMYSRYQQIRTAVTRAGLTNWIALDDDPFESWPDHDRRLIRTDPDLGLSSLPTQQELQLKLRALMGT
ncbi:HAD domain-containing protein [Pseudomonas chlororaphis]|uniref:HAD domain-containing protein n=1 Tax=Pseudomonas chlororaphis TaxID=587753 RepID=UPI0023651082|nr:HAD domain-containing protein [Pseudomonas chlororaphis]WDH24421.1 HAD domain-containing protein [Pseudomonas chlororaphis]